MEPRLKEKYKKEIVPKMLKEHEYKNVMEVPKIEKIVVNMGVGSATQNIKELESGSQDLAMITGQKPVITKAKKSIAGFKVRQGNPIGCMVTLRGSRMYEFLDRLLSIAIPRIRDFRGLSKKSFDGSGNYTISGLVFSYLLLLAFRKGSDKERIKKGLFRGLLLLIIGYSLRINIVSWFSGYFDRYILVVDVLQCIGLSLIILIGL